MRCRSEDRTKCQVRARATESQTKITCRYWQTDQKGNLVRIIGIDRVVVLHIELYTPVVGHSERDNSGRPRRSGGCSVVHDFSGVEQSHTEHVVEHRLVSWRAREHGVFHSKVVQRRSHNRDNVGVRNDVSPPIRKRAIERFERQVDQRLSTVVRRAVRVTGVGTKSLIAV